MPRFRNEEPVVVPYQIGDIVWVKLRSSEIWWPGEVSSAQDFRFVNCTRRPFAVVEFFSERTYEHVPTSKLIFPFECAHKDEFKKHGTKKNLCLESRNNFNRDLEWAEERIMELRQNAGAAALATTAATARPESLIKAHNNNNTSSGSSRTPNGQAANGRTANGRTATAPSKASILNDSSIHIMDLGSASSSSWRSHGHLPERNLKCNACDFHTRSMDVLLIHRSHHHEQSNRNSRCGSTSNNTSNNSSSCFNARLPAMGNDRKHHELLHKEVMRRTNSSCSREATNALWRCQSRHVSIVIDASLNIEEQRQVANIAHMTLESIERVVKPHRDRERELELELQRYRERELEREREMELERKRHRMPYTAENLTSIENYAQRRRTQINARDPRGKRCHQLRATMPAPPIPLPTATSTPASRASRKTPSPSKSRRLTRSASRQQKESRSTSPAAAATLAPPETPRQSGVKNRSAADRRRTMCALANPSGASGSTSGSTSGITSGTTSASINSASITSASSTSTGASNKRRRQKKSVTMATSVPTVTPTSCTTHLIKRQRKSMDSSSSEAQNLTVETCSEIAVTPDESMLEPEADGSSVKNASAASLELHRRLLAEWGEDEQEELPPKQHEANGAAKPKSQAVAEHLEEQHEQQDEVFGSSSSSSGNSSSFSPESSDSKKRIRNIPKKDRRDVVMQEFDMGADDAGDDLRQLDDSIVIQDSDSNSNGSVVFVDAASAAKATQGPVPAPAPAVAPSSKSAPSANNKTSSCFDFDEEEEDEDAALQPVSLPADGQNGLSYRRRTKPQPLANGEDKQMQRRASGENFMGFGDDVDAAALGAESEPETAAAAAGHDAELEADADQLNLPIKERQKRIFKSRNKSQQAATQRDEPQAEEEDDQQQQAVPVMHPKPPAQIQQPAAASSSKSKNESHKPLANGAGGAIIDIQTERQPMSATATSTSKAMTIPAKVRTKAERKIKIQTPPKLNSKSPKLSAKSKAKFKSNTKTKATLKLYEEGVPTPTPPPEELSSNWNSNSNALSINCNSNPNPNPNSSPSPSSNSPSHSQGLASPVLSNSNSNSNFTYSSSIVSNVAVISAEEARELQRSVPTIPEDSATGSSTVIILEDILLPNLYEMPASATENSNSSYQFPRNRCPSSTSNPTSVRSNRTGSRSNRTVSRSNRTGSRCSSSSSSSGGNSNNSVQPISTIPTPASPSPPPPPLPSVSPSASPPTSPSTSTSSASPARKRLRRHLGKLNQREKELLRKYEKDFNSDEKCRLARERWNSCAKQNAVLEQEQQQFEQQQKPEQQQQESEDSKIDSENYDNFQPTAAKFFRGPKASNEELAQLLMEEDVEEGQNKTPEEDVEEGQNNEPEEDVEEGQNKEPEVVTPDVVEEEKEDGEQQLAETVEEQKEPEEPVEMQADEPEEAEEEEEEGEQEGEVTPDLEFKDSGQDGTDSRICAVMTHPIAGFTNTFMLCSLTNNNNFTPLNNEALYLDGQNHLVPVPLEALTEPPRLPEGHPLSAVFLLEGEGQVVIHPEQLQMFQSGEDDDEQEAALEGGQPVAALLEADVSDQIEMLGIMTPLSQVAGEPTADDDEEEQQMPSNVLELSVKGHQLQLNIDMLMNIADQPENVVLEIGGAMFRPRDILNAAKTYLRERDLHLVNVADVALEEHAGVAPPPTDLLAEALAGSDVIDVTNAGVGLVQLNTHGCHQVAGAVASDHVMDFIAHANALPSTAAAAAALLTSPQPPVTASTSETNALLNQTPIMSTLESPSRGGHLRRISPMLVGNLEESLAVIGVTNGGGVGVSGVPTSLELPITVTNPAIAPRVAAPGAGRVGVGVGVGDLAKFVPY